MAPYEKPDHWSQKAQREGYPARSVYKLKEMDEKFGLFKGGRPFKVLDLGAAPGSWSLYCLKTYGKSILLTAVDLSPLSAQHGRDFFCAENCRFFRGDMTDSGIRGAILAEGPFNLVMSDAAPATTGNRSLDTLRSLALAEAALDYAQAALEREGRLVIKVFQGGDTAALLKRIRECFETGKAFKPEACRNNSFETYYLGLGKKGC